MESFVAWPSVLWVVRHGESAGNVARIEADACGASEIGLKTRDVDVPLSALGERQAAALGDWFGGMPEQERPTAILCSPYIRARATANLVAERGNLGHIPIVVDERLREKEFGVLDGLTRRGIEERFPEQAKLRAALGKFYHRPPGGESWCDVILRLRNVIDTLSREFRGERVLLVGHQVVVSCTRYLLERMTEEEILSIDRQHEIANCSVTIYETGSDEHGHARPLLKVFNQVTPVARAGETITRKSDGPEKSAH